MLVSLNQTSMLVISYDKAIDKSILYFKMYSFVYVYAYV